MQQGSCAKSYPAVKLVLYPALSFGHKKFCLRAPKNHECSKPFNFPSGVVDNFGYIQRNFFFRDTCQPLL